MIREHFEFRQTIATILADEPGHVEAAKSGMMAARQEVERQIATDPYFSATLEPYTPEAPGRTVGRMARAAEEAGVGPMAAVAGAIAWAGVEAMVEAGASFGLVDNGGDIALVSDREVKIGVFAGASPLSGRIAFLLPPQEGILGICTSSATVGPSISFGIADAVTVFSPDVAVADAWATAICNQITRDDTSILDALPGTEIRGVLAVIGDVVIRWGDLPPVVRARVDERLITAGRPPV
ncbi:MAG: UPF0280 family protein [Methanoculleus bourgensis]|jgi:ApbE superfamily uncharacterized protein (UPF0280 family)|uniref:UPF0280 family protein n=1 Tax=Methanoculleus bourgensis TaxID=83986 RepID=UPI0007BCD1EE|nr:UPF0280 family protein [Methanoculleus bourgensis]NQS73883.1 UPF0280 family protein [Methanoculleus sp.]SAI88794.1 hypothetical protein MBBA_1946 [Methanoculleus bourgensis]